MPANRVLVLGTAARGGIRSVIEAYEKSGFYTPGRAEFVPSHVEGSLWQRLLAALQAYWLVALRLLTGRVALLHLHMSMRGSFWRKFLFLNMARLAHVPVIIHLHGSEFAVFYNGSSGWARRAIQFIFDKADGIVVLSAFWKDFIGTLTSNQVTVIGNFVPDNFDERRAVAQRNRRHVLFLGQFGARKGIYDLLPVFVDVCKKVPGARLFCGGNGEIEQVREIVSSLGSDAYIEVPGWAGGEEKRALLHQCGVFVLPSYNEGLPMAIIEAMSFSMAVISTRVGGIPELVDAGNGRLVDPGDRKQLEDALVDVLSRDDTELATMGAASRSRYVSSYSPQACMGGMRSLYQSLGVAP